MAGTGRRPGTLAVDAAARLVPRLFSLGFYRFFLFQKAWPSRIRELKLTAGFFKVSAPHWTSDGAPFLLPIRSILLPDGCCRISEGPDKSVFFRVEGSSNRGDYHSLRPSNPGIRTPEAGGSGCCSGIGPGSLPDIKVQPLLRSRTRIELPSCFPLSPFVCGKCSAGIHFPLPWSNPCHVPEVHICSQVRYGMGPVGLGRKFISGSCERRGAGLLPQQSRTSLDGQSCRGGTLSGEKDPGDRGPFPQDSRRVSPVRP